MRTDQGSFFVSPPETKLCPKSTTYRKSIHFSEPKSALAFSREQLSLNWTFLLSTHVAYFATASNLLSQEKKEIFHIKREKNVLEVKFND